MVSAFLVLAENFHNVKGGKRFLLSLLIVCFLFHLFSFCFVSIFLCFFDLDSESVLKKIDKKIIYGKFLFFLFFLKPIRH